MTNREWLMEQMQSMSDEELGEKIARTSEKCEFCLIEPEYECGTELRCCADEVENWLKAEHKEKPKLSEAERVILENIDKRWVWICRNEDGNLRVIRKRPKKYTKVWIGEIGGYADIDVFDHLFQFVKWSDNEPYEISELLKGE